MLRPKDRPPRRYWEALADDLLLDVELTTDSPQNLADLVTELPAGDEEPYVEYKYDLRRTDSEKLRCVHCHQPHLAGYVMKKNGKRFFVGHICGNHIYGEDFDEYTSDYNAAVNRQQSIRRKREIENATKPFLEWLQEISTSGIFDHYDSVVEQMWDKMPWIAENLTHASWLDERVTKAKLPRNLFGEDTRPRLEFMRLSAEMTNFAMRLVADPEWQNATAHNIRLRFEVMLRRLDKVLRELKEVEDFFQPAALLYICDLANEEDNPKKRKYSAGLMSISCERAKGGVSTVQIPRKFKLPERAPLERFRAALLGMSDATAA